MGSSDWVVLKFGGTSVSNLPNWRNIAAIVNERRAVGARVMVVHSAVSGITDKLEKLLQSALSGEPELLLGAIEERHTQLAAELGIGPSSALQASFTLLRTVAARIHAAHALSDAERAVVMAQGELMATELGARFLQAQGVTTRWLDAREYLRAEERGNASARANYLSATCVFTPDAALQSALAAGPPVVLTQGFIASNAAAETVILGRGGSDTSGAYFAAKLQAARLEIWTDVPGMFSANPRSTPSARLLRALHYDEAQEIASSGAKVLHPRCMLPAKQGGIPVWVYATQTPKLEGTHISASSGAGAAQVKAVCLKKGITLLSLDSPGMWHQVGFMADAFQVFKRHGMSVDQVSTSETSVTVSLDPSANTLDQAALEKLTAELGQLCRVQLIGPCAQLSLVGRNIRGILHQMGEALAVFADQRIHLVSQAANDLNFTFVVDEDQGDRLVQQLHDLLIRPVRGDTVLGPTWEELYGPQPAPRAGSATPPWWRRRRNELLALAAQHECAYVYDGDVVRANARALQSLQSVDRLFYAMKANPHTEILQLLAAEGLGIECVSRGEIERALDACPKLERERLLYTPNFAARDEYQWAFAQGVHVTIDNLYILQNWPEVFSGRSVLVRVDGGIGRGHHQHVRTAGQHSKFGVPLDELPELARLAAANRVTVHGLHAHPGSGIFEVGSWAETLQLLLAESARFGDLQVLNIGGGLGVPESLEQPVLDLAALDATLAQLRAARPEIAIWMEPGRYLVANAGVLLARVNQIKAKDDVRYVGVATGMNSLIRPALYGAWHDIVNLSRLDEPATQTAHVVGPICESADYLGHDRQLPPTAEGDVILVATVGAYGHAMSSRYNLREPAIELMI